MRVEWTRNAITDLAGIYEYIAKDSPRYALLTAPRPSKTQGRATQYLFHQCVSVFISGLGIEAEHPNSRRLKPVLRTGTGLMSQVLRLKPDQE